MADNTSYLGLILPGFGEYEDIWWEPLNQNFIELDAQIQALDEELIAARQSKPTLLAFLQAGHDANGNLLPATEVVKARNSFAYGNRDGTNTLFTLVARLNQVDTEVFLAREGRGALRDALAYREFGIGNMILSGSQNINGYPTWMAPLANKVQVDGSVTPLYLLIEGHVSRIRTLKEITISGAAGTYYVYAEYQANGVVVVDGDSTAAPPALANGLTANDTTPEPTLFADLTKDFTTEDVQAGDLLDLVSSADAGTYLISEVAPAAEAAQLKIKGIFPVGSLSSINYNVRDPLAVTVGFASSEAPTAGRLYLGECDWDGAAVTAVRPRHFKDTFVSEWRTFDVSTSPTQEEIFTHNLGSDQLDISVQVSQEPVGNANRVVEELALAGLKNTLNYTPSNGTLAASNGTLAVDEGTLDVSDVVLDAGDQSVVTQPALTGSPELTGSVALTGTVGGSLTGDVQPTRSAAAKWDKNKIWVKNLVPSVFYKDYAGTELQTGKIRVIVRRRG